MTVDRTGLPKVTVVMPALNEAAHLADTLASMKRQRYPAELVEVIVVDNGSTDATVAIATAAGVTVLEEPERSPFKARNRAVLAAAGDYLAFIDADCTADPGWIEELVRTARDTGSRYVAGRIENVFERDTLGNHLLGLRTAADVRRRMATETHSVAAGNMLVAKEVFRAYGLFNPHVYGSDDEMSQRAAAGGERIAYAAGAVVYHHCDLGDLEYLVRSFRVPFGQARNGRVGVLAAIRRFPWRPGFGAARAAARELGEQRVGLVRLWAYMWLDRAFGFAGGLAGACVAAWRWGTMDVRRRHGNPRT